MLSNYEKALNEIRELDESLQRAKIVGATVNKNYKSVSVDVISNKHVEEKFEDKIADIISKYMPEHFKSVVVGVKKVVADEQLVKSSIVDICTVKFLSISHAITSDCIDVSIDGDEIKYLLKVMNDVGEYIEKAGLITEINFELENRFCSVFSGSVSVVGVAEEAVFTSSVAYEDKLEKIGFRRFKVADATKFLDDETYDTAVYISDYNEAEKYVGVCYVAGKVEAISIKTSSKGNDYYSFDLFDNTGRVNVKYFTRAKDKLKKMEKIAVGSMVICRCESSEFNGRCSLIAKGINLCELPKEFKMEEKPTKPVPDEYSLVFPVEAEIINQGDMFTEREPICDALKGKTFVVVDVETTGVEFSVDRITEIAAVKIVDGVIKEHFTTLINPERKIPEKIISLTGIDDDMVANAPLFVDIGGDFLKFMGDCPFVAHNSDFDSRFIRNELRNGNYGFNPPIIDTLPLAIQTVKGLKNYKLNTICEYFGIEFRHHRALSDAYATAEMFIKLINVKKSL